LVPRIENVDFLIRQIDGVAPSFSQKPVIRQEEDGRKLLFECKIKADPKPTVVWYHDGTAVAASNRHKASLAFIFTPTPTLV